MDLNWSEEQAELRATLRRLLTKARQTGATTWPTLASTGLLGLGVAESLEGSGAGLVEEQILFEEAGRALVGEPLYSTIALVLPLLVASDDAEQLVPAVVSGQRKYCLAWSLGDTYALQPEAVGAGLVTERVDGALVITGTRRLVPDLSTSDTALVLDRDAGAHLVDLTSPGVVRVDRRAVDASRPLGDLFLDRAPATPLAGTGSAVSSMMRRGIVLAAAEMIGLAEAVLEMMQEHAGTRTQFGRPIGTFQAVAHPIANVYADIELARSLSILVALTLDDAGSDGAEIAALAVSAGALGLSACETAIQVHGGMGMTWESPLHRYYKRARYLRTLMGPPEAHRRHIAEQRMRVRSAAD
ncbi:acyl-CoA dehydrogenase family protein [Streptomyces sp. NPDC001982]|uniref:acyl-CoA dehydrogenase family protein n=1 Tax=Streptomyces sp. NPDC001982 TaxID=3154405 RepID=UPI00331758AA